MSSALLWDLQETARQLGDVSTRTVRRLIERNEIETKKIGRRLMVKRESVIAWVEGDKHTDKRVERGVLGEKACQKQHASRTKMGSTNAMIRRTTGPVSPTQAAEELADLLSPKAKEKQRRSSPGGNLKYSRKQHGTKSQCQDSTRCS